MAGRTSIGRTSVVLDVKCARGLRSVAWFGLNQDPYVKATVAPSGATAQTKSIWGGGTDPRWERTKHHACLVLPVTSSDRELTVEIKNKNNVMEDEVIGAFVLDLAVVLDEPNTMVVPLSHQGELEVTVFRQTEGGGGTHDADLDWAIAQSLAGGGGGGSGYSGGGGGGGGGASLGSGGRLGGTVLHRDNSNDQKRAAAAAAAEARQNNWRAGGGVSSEKTKQLNQRRAKDQLIGKIQAIYQSRGSEAPIGLGASSVEVLQKHLASLESSASSGAARREAKEAQLARNIRTG